MEEPREKMQAETPTESVQPGAAENDTDGGPGQDTTPPEKTDGPPEGSAEPAGE